MSRTVKTREAYVHHGLTTALVDNEMREFTLVAVVTEETAEDIITEYDTKIVGKKFIATTTSEEVTEKTYTLGIGLSVVNPLDRGVASLTKGKLIAAGKAVKPTKALLTLTSKERVFYDDFVEDIVNFYAKRITNNPNKFIKVSPKKQK